MGHPPQARGGASKADVVLSREPIDFPHVETPDAMVLVSQEAYDVYTGQIEDMRALNVLEPLRVGTQAIQAATETANMVLRIDDVIASKSGGGGGGAPGGMPPGMGGMGGMGGMM